LGEHPGLRDAQAGQRRTPPEAQRIQGQKLQRMIGPRALVPLAPGSTIPLPCHVLALDFHRDLDRRLADGHSTLASRSTRGRRRFSVFALVHLARPPCPLASTNAGWSPSWRRCRSRGPSPSLRRPSGAGGCMGRLPPPHLCPALAACPRPPPWPTASLLTGCDRPWRSWGSPCASGKAASACRPAVCFARQHCGRSGGCRPGVETVGSAQLWRPGARLLQHGSVQLDPCRQLCRRCSLRSTPASIPAAQRIGHWRALAPLR